MNAELYGPDGDLLWAKAALPNPVPKGWRLREDCLDGASYESATGLFAIVSGSTEADGKRWLHLSVSRRNRPPDWYDLKTAKQALLGDRYAVLVFPPQRYWVSIHPHCLHLFACEDGHPLPEFSLAGLTL